MVVSYGVLGLSWLRYAAKFSRCSLAFAIQIFAEGETIRRNWFVTFSRGFCFLQAMKDKD